jgi:uncharacterized protein HemX
LGNKIRLISTAIVISAVMVGIVVIPMFEDKKVETVSFDARDCQLGTSTDEFGNTKCMTQAEKDFSDNAEALPNDHVLIYEKIGQIIEEQKAQRELLEEIYDLGS